MPAVFIGIGSNLGDRGHYFELAQKSLQGLKAVRNLKCSPVYETEPFNAAGGKFLNAVWSFEADLSPRKLLEKLQAIEKKAGRSEKGQNQPRTLDLDILFYGDQIIRETGLTVPHPRFQERDFVLVPFCDLAPDFIHPVFKKTIKELLNNLSATHNGQRSTMGSSLRVAR